MQTPPQDSHQANVETNLTVRWEKGYPHHPRSVEFYRLISEADQKYGNDYFCWKDGGDGDNGEHLMFSLDVLFELEDARAKDFTESLTKQIDEFFSTVTAEELDKLLEKSNFDFYNKVGEDLPHPPNPATLQYAAYILNHYKKDSLADQTVLAKDLERHGFTP